MSSILAHFPSLKLRSRDRKLRSGKRLRFAASCLAWAESSNKRQAVDDQSLESRAENACWLLDLPEELLDGVLADMLDVKDLCAISQTCTKFRSIGEEDERWRCFFEEHWGSPSDLVKRAAELAGSWRKLYAAKFVMDSQASPWMKPTSYELSAAVDNISVNGLGLTHPGSPELAKQEAGSTGPLDVHEDKTPRTLLFLVDGSGSVTEDDFDVMTSFMTFAWRSINHFSPHTKVGIIQFSNDVRVELDPASMDFDAFDSQVSKMTRMNGGTNISYAISKAGKVLGGTKGNGGHTSVVLLTDGRIDRYQASEALDMSTRLTDEVPGMVSFYAFGVGRGVDKKELLRIISAGSAIPKEANYMGLCTYEDAPW